MLPAHITLSAAEIHTLRTSRVIIPVADAVFRIEGPGTISCLQGLLTCDVVKLASGAAAWGAFLTAKGMIIVDAWVVRDGEAAWIVVPSDGRAAMTQLFSRTLPPRLAKATDCGESTRAWWLIGGNVAALDRAFIATPQAHAPFAELMLAPAGADTALVHQGWKIGAASDAVALKVLLGWPSLGREIDDRTLPQEVRFDELDGVRYDKGCYTGQETIARLHFRGHANRTLRGISWMPGDGPTDVSVMAGGKHVGTLRTIAQIGEAYRALAVLRREVAIGDSVRIGESECLVIEPPFEIDPPAVA